MNEQEASALSRLIESQQKLIDSMNRQAEANQVLSEAILALAQALQTDDEPPSDAGAYLDGSPR